jgi:hypothetical protein
MIPVYQAWSPARNSPFTLARSPWQKTKLPLKPTLGASSPRTMALTLMAIPTLLSATVSYVGFRQGSLDRGIASGLGYTIGVLGALGTLFGMAIMLGVATIPSTPITKPMEVALPPAPAPLPEPATNTALV